MFGARKTPADLPGSAAISSKKSPLKNAAHVQPAMTIKIRNAQHEDAGKIAALGQCVWIDTYATAGVSEVLSKYVISHFAPGNIRDLLASKTVLVAEIDGHLVGYVVLSVRDAVTEIDNFYVLPGFQRRGIGKEIIAHICRDHSHLWLSCWEQNKNAIGFYASQGFVEDGESFFDLDGELYRNVILTRCTSDGQAGSDDS